MWPFTPAKKQLFFNDEEQQRIVQSIQSAEKRTSGEIRLYVESKCKFVDPLDRAAEIFYGLKMDQTSERNAVIVYVALKDKQLAIFADEGIHAKTGEDFWKSNVQLMLSHFNKENYAAGIVTVIQEIGEALFLYFPYDEHTDKNELPDDIVFGQ